MKKALAILLAMIFVTGAAFADIQSPPGSRETPVRKLSRALSNIIYGFMDVPVNFENTLKTEGAPEAFSYGIVEGLDRAGIRLGYGMYELVNFRTPKYKESFRAPYPFLDYDTVHGYTEFPPSYGFSTSKGYVRSNAN